MEANYFTILYWFRRRQWQPTPVLLPGKSHGQRSLVGCSPWGSLKVGRDSATSLSLFTFHFHALEEEMATHSSVLAWRIPGLGWGGGLVGCRLWGRRRLKLLSSSSSSIVLVLPYINMNPPPVYTCSPSWTPLPPPSPYHPSGSSQCTSPKHPVSCIEPGLAICFLHDIIHVSTPFSQIIPPLPSPTESKRLFYTSVSLLLSRIQGCRYHLSKFHIYALVYCILSSKS